jgi:hypothetical protein
MSSVKAIVLEKDGPMLTVLAADGSFQKIRCRKEVEIGAEIELPATAARQIPGWRIAAGVAAVFLVALMGIFGWNIYQPRTAMAMLSVDINPSLQLTLDQKGRILEWESLNPDAEQVLSGLAIKGEPWEKALEQIIGHSVDLNYLNQEHTWVVVGYSPVEENIELPAEKLNSEEIVKHVEEAAAGKGVTPKVAVYQMTSQEKVQAKENGLSLGEYALVDTAQKAGVELQAGEVKKTEERTRLLEKPEFQEQMLKDNRVKGNEKKAANVGSQTNSNQMNNSNKAGEINPWNAWGSSGSSGNQGTNGSGNMLSTYGIQAFGLNNSWLPGIQFPTFHMPSSASGQNKASITDKDTNKNSNSQNQDNKNNGSGKSNNGNQNNGINGGSGNNSNGGWGGTPYRSGGSPYSNGGGTSGSSGNNSNGNNNSNPYGSWGGSPYSGWGSSSYGTPYSNPYSNGSGSGNNNNSKENNQNDKKQNENSDKKPSNNGNNTNGGNKTSSSSGSNSKGGSINNSYGSWGSGSFGNGGKSPYAGWGSNPFGR